MGERERERVGEREREGRGGGGEEREGRLRPTQLILVWKVSWFHSAEV